MDLTNYLLAFSAGLATGMIISFGVWAFKSIYKAAKLFFNY